MGGSDGGRYDAIVIGSGFGGGMAAHALVAAGLRVLMIERGGWVRRGRHNWAEDGAVDLTPQYSVEAPYERVPAGGGGWWPWRRAGPPVGGVHCVGGPSVFYGGVSLRLRESDFRTDPRLHGEVDGWPVDYATLEPYYARAERLLGVAGERGADPTEPLRSGPYPAPSPSLSPVSARVAAAARRLDLDPFPLPLAIRFQGAGRRCVRCATCDCFACAVQAKNDIATAVLPQLIDRGLLLATDTVAVRLVRSGRRITAVECVGREDGLARRFRADRIFLAAGALASAHLVLASGLEEASAAPGLVGATLMRHCSAIVYGFFPGGLEGTDIFHKQVGVHDFYFGHPSVARPRGRLGSIQQVHTPPMGLVHAHLPWPLGRMAGPVVARMTGLLAMAEDQPSRANRLELAGDGRTDRYGRPVARIRHRHSARDLAARGALARQARRILREAGAALTYTHRIDTFSHAVGTLRMGADPARSVVDPDGRLRGLDNLFVVDGSVMPTAAGVNPSLTIAAHSLRVAELAAGAAGLRAPADAPPARRPRRSASPLAGQPRRKGDRV